MTIALLTTQVRSSQRAPILVKRVNADMLERLFPGMIKRAGSDPTNKNAQPVQPLSVILKNGKNHFPVQIPMEVFNATGATSQGDQSQRNGKHPTGLFNRNAPAPVQPDRKPAPSPLPRAGGSASVEVGRNFPDPIPPVPSIPISKEKVDQSPGEENSQGTRKSPVETDLPADESPDSASRSAPVQTDFLRTTRSALGLRRLLEKHPDLPNHSFLLGTCEDGLPLMLDLFDPGPGALISVGDDREGQLELLRNAIDSTASRNSPRALQFLVISHQHQTWKSWVNERGFNRHCLGIIGIEDECVQAWVLRLADWTEQRRLGQISGPPVLMVMDTLSFISRLAYDVCLNFDWLAKEGPAAQVWPLAAISTDLAASLGARMLRGFQSQILGYTKNTQVYTHLFGLSEEDAGRIKESRHFGIQVGQRWINFHLPA